MEATTIQTRAGGEGTRRYRGWRDAAAADSGTDRQRSVCAVQAQGEGIREARLRNRSVVERLGVEDRQDSLPFGQIKSGTDDPTRPCIAIRPHEQVLFDQPVVTV